MFITHFAQEPGVNYGLIDPSPTSYVGDVYDSGFQQGNRRFARGAVSRAADGGARFIYVTFGGAVLDGDVVLIDSAFSAVVEITTANSTGMRGSMVGVAVNAANNGDSGWVQVAGLQGVKSVASAAANTIMNTTTTAGQISATNTAGTQQLTNIFLNTAAGSTNNWPAAAPAYIVASATIGDQPIVGVTN